MQIFRLGKTDKGKIAQQYIRSSPGFILLRTLLFSAVFLVLLSAALSTMVLLFRQSSVIKAKAEKILLDRNDSVDKELYER